MDLLNKIMAYENGTDSIPNVIGVLEVAAQLKVSEQRVRELLRKGELKGRQVGRQWITTFDDVELYQRRFLRNGPSDQKRAQRSLPRLKALSFFSGALGLDQGLEEAGIKLLLACEFDRDCRSTIIANRPNIGLIGDIWNYTGGEIREYAGLSSTDTIDVVVGGPPCQAFSTAGTRRGFGDKRGNVFLRFVDLILELKPRYAVIENVRGLLSQPINHTPHSERSKGWSPDVDELPGGALDFVLRLLESGGYKVTFNLYNSANFGVPQSRERVILICTLDDEPVPHLMPINSNEKKHDLPPWLTVRKAFKDMDEDQAEYVNFPEERLRFYRMLKSGEYWKHLPEHLHREALGNSLDSGGGKTGFFRRLDWNKPSCTLVTSPIMPATDICHPAKDRPISIQEYMRIQQFPDDWKVEGSVLSRYKQLGNAVPVGLGKAVGIAIMMHMKGHQQSPPADFTFSRYKSTDDVSWRAQREAAINRVKEGKRQAKLF
jgi:DNA (cytosine-5)-methyltransferase 1